GKVYGLKPGRNLDRFMRGSVDHGDVAWRVMESRSLDCDVHLVRRRVHRYRIWGFADGYRRDRLIRESVNHGDVVAEIVRDIDAVRHRIDSDANRAGADGDVHRAVGIAVDDGHGVVAAVRDISAIRIRIDRHSQWAVADRDDLSFLPLAVTVE